MNWKEFFKPTWKKLAVVICFLLGAYLLIFGISQISSFFIFLKSENIDNSTRVSDAISGFWFIMIGIGILESSIKRNFNYFSLNRLKVILTIVLIFLSFFWNMPKRL